MEALANMVPGVGRVRDALARLTREDEPRERVGLPEMFKRFALALATCALIVCGLLLLVPRAEAYTTITYGDGTVVYVVTDGENSFYTLDEDIASHTYAVIYSAIEYNRYSVCPTLAPAAGYDLYYTQAAIEEAYELDSSTADVDDTTTSVVDGKIKVTATYPDGVERTYYLGLGDSDTYVAYDADGNACYAVSQDFYDSLTSSLNSATRALIEAHLYEEEPKNWIDRILDDMAMGDQPLVYLSMMFVGFFTELCAKIVDAVQSLMNTVYDLLLDYGVFGNLDGDMVSGTTVHEASGTSTTSTTGALLDDDSDTASGGTSTTKTLYSLAESISETVAEPVAMMLLSFALMAQLLQIASRMGEGPGDAPALRQLVIFVVVAAFYLFFVDHALEVMVSIYTVLAQLVGSIMDLVQLSSQEIVFDITIRLEDGTALLADGSTDTYDLGKVWLLLVNAVVLTIITIWVFSAVLKFVMQAYGASLMRGLQIYFLAAFAPLPMATYVLRETRQWGIGYVRHFCTICLQGAIIYVIICAFPILVSTVGSTLSANVSDGFVGILVGALELVAIARAFNTLIDHTGEISSMILGG